MTLFKTSLLKRAKKWLDFDHFSLVAGMVFGDISSMTPHFKQNLKIIGMLHVVSASGYNVSFLLSVSSFFLRKYFSRRSWFFLSIFQIFGYGLVTGWQPAMARAVLMSSLSLFASLIMNKQYHPLWSLGVVVVFMVLGNREYLTSISFQFSVLSTLGIIVFLSRGKKKESFSLGSLLGDVFSYEGNEGRKQYKSAVFRVFRDSIQVTLAAQALVLPLAIIHFGEMSLISVLANTALLWFTPLITSVGFALVVVAQFSLSDFFTYIISFFSWISIYSFSSAVDFLAGFRWGFIVINKEIPWYIAGYWYFMILFFLFIKNRKNNTLNVVKIY